MHFLSLSYNLFIYICISFYGLTITSIVNVMEFVLKFIDEFVVVAL